jgi:hypothetical protein
MWPRVFAGLVIAEVALVLIAAISYALSNTLPVEPGQEGLWNLLPADVYYVSTMLVIAGAVVVPLLGMAWVFTRLTEASLSWVRARGQH